MKLILKQNSFLKQIRDLILKNDYILWIKVCTTNMELYFTPKYKYMSVNNTTLYFIYNKNSILSGRHVLTFIRSSSGPLGKQIQELSMFQCIVGSQMLTDCVIWMWNTYVCTYWNPCDGLGIKRLKIIWDGGILKPILYKRLYKTWFYFLVFKMWTLILHLSVEWGTDVYLPSMARRLDDIFTSREISYFLVALLCVLAD